MGVGSNPTSDKYFSLNRNASECDNFSSTINTDSRVAQWKRAGPITQRSVDRNYALLTFLFFVFVFFCTIYCITLSPLRCVPNTINSRVAQWKRAGPITQRSVDRNYALLEFLKRLRNKIFTDIFYHFGYNCQDGRVV